MDQDSRKLPNDQLACLHPLPLDFDKATGRPAMNNLLKQAKYDGQVRFPSLDHGIRGPRSVLTQPYHVQPHRRTAAAPMDWTGLDRFVPELKVPNHGHFSVVVLYKRSSPPLRNNRAFVVQAHTLLPATPCCPQYIKRGQ